MSAIDLRLKTDADAAPAPDPAPDPAPAPALRRAESLRRRLRRRAWADAAMALLLVPGAALLSSDPHTQLRLTIVAAGFALLAFMIRRSQDMADIRADLRARDAALAGRGISIADWHAGAPLPPWEKRVAKSDS